MWKLILSETETRFTAFVAYGRRAQTRFQIRGSVTRAISNGMVGPL